MAEFEYNLRKHRIDYALLWEEKFEASTLDSTLWHIITGTEKSELQTYTKDNIHLEDQILTIKALHDPNALYPYTTGHIATVSKARTFKEGYIEVIASMLNPPAAQSRIYLQTPDKVKTYLHQSPSLYESDGLDTFRLYTIDKDSNRIFSFDSPFSLHASIGVPAINNQKNNNDEDNNEGNDNQAQTIDLFERYLKLHQVRYYEQLIPKKLF